MQGEKQALDAYVQRLVDLYDIKNYSSKIEENGDFADFRIVHSTRDNQIPFITPDIATCAKCENELKNENNRRHHHPFISCVDCGPRYTIIEKLPYDRENTVMGDFELCPDCKGEYTTPNDRRCHAQTIACKSCGPKTNITINEAVDILKKGDMLAIKDIGGYHLAGVCKGDCADKIRIIKGRDKKPFAVMFSSIDEIKKYCFVNEKEEETLLSPARPIVLLKKKKDFAPQICGESDYIGAFLPCNPIQIMILDKISPLIMTSANLSGEPIITDDEEIKKFGVDILFHNRRILTPLDDSVVQVVGGKVQFIRRSRGYVPLAIDMGIKAKQQTLCLGADLKSTFCFVNENWAYMSQYFGDLEDERCFDAYKNNIARFGALHGFDTKITVADKHPGYYSSSFCKVDKKIQHHLAHAYSVIAEQQLEGDVLSFVFDGTGYGDDGAVWGGEVFLNTKRVEHLEYTKMPASDEIAKDARLCLACYDGSNQLINKAVESNINIVNSSSMGRLFDAVCSALDIKHYNTYEGECAIALENCARKAKKAYALPLSLNPKEIIANVKSANAPKEEIALGFHFMICDIIVEIAKKYNVKQVVLSGGCFVNRILTTTAIDLLSKNGFNVYINEKVPCGDGGVALGQAYLTILGDD